MAPVGEESKALVTPAGARTISTAPRMPAEPRVARLWHRVPRCRALSFAVSGTTLTEEPCPPPGALLPGYPCAAQVERL